MSRLRSHLPGVPVSALGRAVHLLAAGEVFWRGYPSTSVAVCGALVSSGAGSSAEDPRYCPECVRAALRWCAQSGAAECGSPRRSRR